MKQRRRVQARRGLRMEIYRFIARWHREQGTYPTVREIQKGLRISSTSLVHYHLRRLEEAGLVQRFDRRSRGIRLRQWPDGLRPQEDLISVPFMGFIAAGDPIPDPDAEPQGWIPIPRLWLLETDGLFVLRVRGDSMIDALVRDGDLIVVKPAAWVENGEMAVVWLRDRQATTLKHVYYEPDQRRIRLQPAHPLMQPLVLPEEDVQIQGKVIQVLRNLNGAPLPTVPPAG
ncbi:transcriptional repressor LexA [Thermoflexus hugenholtzii]